MASVAESLAQNFSFKSFNSASELKSRIIFTLLALVVFRLGSYIPLPSINPKALADLFNNNSGGILSMFDMFAGGAVKRMSIFALSIMPYISASIIMQLMSSISPSISKLKKEGESGRKKINQYTRYLTVFLGVAQAYGISVGLEQMTSQAGNVVLTTGALFKFTSTLTLVSGTIFLVWLGEQITSRGVGNGISLIIFSGIVAKLPRSLAGTLELSRTGSISALLILFILLLALFLVFFIVFVERAQRRIVVQYPKRQHGNKLYNSSSTHLPLKINTSGVIPPIFASSLLLLPLTIVGFVGDSGPSWVDAISIHLAHGKALYITLYVFLIVFFSFFYTAVVFNSEETAENLKQNGGFILGIRPGKETASFLDKVLTRLTVLGAAYLSFVCLIPEVLISKFSLPFYFGGTSLLIVVSVTIDTITQVNSHMMAHQYDHLIKKSKLKRR